MKAPKINKYADGGKASKKYAEKSMTPKEWDEYAAGKKWAQYPGSGVNPRGYKSYYDTTQYKFNVNPETGEVDSRDSMAIVEGVPPTAQTIEYDYVNPKLLEKTPQRSFPGVDPNHKPLVIGTAGTYDPNTDINYIDPSKKTGTNPPIVQQYSGGGKITKAPMLKKKVAKYSNGTTVAGVEYDENGNPILSSNNQLMQGQPELNATGSSNFYQGYDRNVQGSTQGTGEKKQGNGQMKNAATGALGSYGSGYYANQQKTGNQGEDMRSSALSGVSKAGAIGAVISGAAAIGDQIGAKKKAEAEEMDAQGNLKNQGKAQRSAIIGGLFSPSKALATRGSYKGGWTDITGKKYAEHLETQAKEQINEEAGAEAFAKRDAGETMTGGNSVNIEQPKEDDAKSKALFGAAVGGFFGGPMGAAQGAGTGFAVGKAKDKKIFKAQGGTIEGKGGPKSDSILSKVDNKGIPAGSFITPAENNGLAKALRAKVLGDNPERKAQFKKEGGETAEVAVSNGEHLFTPKEKSKIVQMLGEEVLEKLAPNAEDDDEMEHEEMSKEEHHEMMKMDMEHKANGGEISATKAREIMRDGTANGKPLTDKQKRYFGWVIGGRKACGGEVKKYADGTEPKGVSGEFAKDFESKKKSSDLKEREALLKEYKTLKGKEDDIAKFRIKQIAKRVGEIENRYPEVKTTTTGAKLESIPDTKPSPLGKKASTGTGRSAVTKKVTEKETFVPRIAEDNQEYPVVPGSENQPVAEAIDPRFKQKTPLNDTQADLLVKSAQSVKPEEGGGEQGSKLGKYLKNNAGTLLETGAALGQMGMGLKATKEERPVDEIDPMFLANVSKAQAEAKYGFTPQENFILDQERQNALNAARFAARNYSGGNAASAFNMEKSAINEAYSSALKKAIANKSLMMDKQQYADQMALQKAQMSRQLFGDKMNAWQQNQQAGSALLGSGIKNLISANRYAKELEAQQQRQQYYNPTFNG